LFANMGKYIGGGSFVAEQDDFGLIRINFIHASGYYDIR
jgi:hypothetical protein